jgi:uncharacterized membrane protein
MTTTDDDLSIAPRRAGLDLRAGPRAWTIRIALLATGAVGAVWLFSAYHQPIRLHLPNLALLQAQPFTIKLHLTAALAAFGIGSVLMLGVKGDRLHRTLGVAWVLIMLTTAVSSFFIHGVNPHGFSPIHALSAWVTIAAPMGFYLARRHQVQAHRRMMTGLFLFGLVLAGALTFLPGRLMFQMFFG